MPRQSVLDMKVSKIYPLLLQKVERKGRTKEELDAVIRWLTGWDMEAVDPVRCFFRCLLSLRYLQLSCSPEEMRH